MFAALAGGFTGLIIAIGCFAFGDGITLLEAFLIYWATAAFTTLGLCMRAFAPAQ